MALESYKEHQGLNLMNHQPDKYCLLCEGYPQSFPLSWGGLILNILDFLEKLISELQVSHPALFL